MEFQTAIPCVTTYEHTSLPSNISNSNNNSNSNSNNNNNNMNPPVTSEGNTYLTEIQIDDGKWTREQTQILINTWKENKHILLNSSSSSSEQFKVWKDILKEVNKLSPPKSLQQCKKKFRNIRYICKTAMNNNKQIGSKKHYPMFYSDFVDIISEYEQSRNNFSDLNFKIEMMNESSHDEWSVEYAPHGDGTYSPENMNRTRSPGRNYSQIGIGQPPKPSSAPPDIEGRSPVRDDNGDVIGIQPSERNARKRSGDGEDGDGKLDSKERRGQKFAQSQEGVRKPGNSFISIMGHHYPPPKRVRHMTNTMIPPAYNDIPPNIRHQQTRQLEFGKDFYPTMATKSPCHEGPLLRPEELSFPPRHIYEKRNKSPIVAHPNNTINLQDKPVKTIHNHEMPHGIVSPGCPPDSDKNLPALPSSDEIHDRFINLQERQMEIFNDMLNRHEQFLMQLLTQQREAAEAAQERDRQFMFKLIEIFVKQK